MLHEKRQKMLKSHRQRNHEMHKSKCRQKYKLQLQLNDLLQEYTKCGLITGDQQYLGHTQYLHCESFAFFTHQHIFRLITQIGIQDCKSILLQCQFPKLIDGVRQIIEEKTLELEESMAEACFKSRNQVLQSISDVASLLSEDKDLIQMFGNAAPQLFLRQLKKSFLFSKTIQTKEFNAIIGLVNLFTYPSFQQAVYLELCEINFLFLIEKYLRSMLHNTKIMTKDSSDVCIVTLLRHYLQFRTQNTTKIINPIFQKILSKFIAKTIKQNIIIDQQLKQSTTTNILIDQFITISLYIQPEEEHIQLLKNTKLFKKLHYAQLLNHYTYHYNNYVKLQLFSNDQLIQLLEATKELVGTPNFDTFLQSVISTFANMLESTKNTEHDTRKLWRLLQQTSTVHLFYNNDLQSDGSKVLIELMDFYSLEKV